MKVTVTEEEILRYARALIELKQQEQNLIQRYQQISGAQTIEWDRESIHEQELSRLNLSSDRLLRERAWRLASDRLMQDRDALNDVWIGLVQTRYRIGQESGDGDYLRYCWDRLNRPYPIDTLMTLAGWLRKYAVPAFQRVCDRWRSQLGADGLRPWDWSTRPVYFPSLTVNPGMTAVPVPCEVEQLPEFMRPIIEAIDPKLAERMGRERYDFDLQPRLGKDLTSFCSWDAQNEHHLINMNATGLHGDASVFVHEVGHSLHRALSGCDNNMESRELIAFSMQFLALRHLDRLYQPHQVAGAYIQFLEWQLELLACEDALLRFEHWAYNNPDLAAHPDECDRIYGRLIDEALPGIDYSGLEAKKGSSWQWIRSVLFERSFYGLAHSVGLLGAIQVWQNSLDDYEGAVDAVKRTMQLADSVPLVQVFDTAGVKLPLDEVTVGVAVQGIEAKIDELLMSINNPPNRT